MWSMSARVRTIKRPPWYHFWSHEVFWCFLPKPSHDSWSHNISFPINFYGHTSPSQSSFRFTLKFQRSLQFESGYFRCYSFDIGLVELKNVYQGVAISDCSAVPWGAHEVCIILAFLCLCLLWTVHTGRKFCSMEPWRHLCGLSATAHLPADWRLTIKLGNFSVLLSIFWIRYSSHSSVHSICSSFGKACIYSSSFVCLNTIQLLLLLELLSKFCRRSLISCLIFDSVVVVRVWSMSHSSVFFYCIGKVFFCRCSPSLKGETS